MAALAQPVLDLTRVKGAVEALPLPKGVHLSTIFFDKDHAGDPAVRIIFSVSKKVPLTASRLRVLTGLLEKVEDAVRPLQLGALTYIRFRDVA